MPALVRLKRRADFLRVAGARRKWVTPGLILQAAPTPAGGGARDGAVLVRDGVRPDGSPPDSPVGETLVAEKDSALGTQPGVARVGFTVSRKVGNAVRRNRAKRRLRAAATAVLEQAARPGMDYVLIGRAETVERPFDALLADLAEAVRRLSRDRVPGERGPDKRGPDKRGTRGAAGRKTAGSTGPRQGAGEGAGS